MEVRIEEDYYVVEYPESGEVNKKESDLIGIIEDLSGESIHSLVIQLKLRDFLNLAKENSRNALMSSLKFGGIKKVAWVVLGDLPIDLNLNSDILTGGSRNFQEKIYYTINDAVSWIKKDDLKARISSRISSIWSRIINNGVEKARKTNKHVETKLANIVYVVFGCSSISAVLLSPMTFIRQAIDLNFGALFTIALFGIIILSYFLNGAGMSFLGRFIFINAWISSIVIFPIVLGTQSSYYFTYSIAILSTSIVIQLIFSFKFEKVVYALLLLSTLVGSYYYFDFLESFDNNSSESLVKIALMNSVEMKTLIFWFIINAITFALLRVYSKMTDKYASMNFSYQAINVNLEKIVREKTETLLERNRKLEEYAYLNSHKLMGPFCTIKGLLQLKELNPSEDDLDGIQTHISNAIDEMESVIHSIQESTGK